MQRKPAPLILLVNDDEDVLDALSELLARKGYAVAEARDGLEALKYLLDNQILPSVILLDLVMPVMDGWEFLTRKADDDKFAPIPVVLVSTTETGRPSNIAALPKPWNMADLLNLLKEYCVSEGVTSTHLTE